MFTLVLTAMGVAAGYCLARYEPVVKAIITQLKK